MQFKIDKMKRNSRIDFRLTEDEKNIIQQSATINGFKSISEYIVATMLKESKSSIIENSKFLKTIEDQKIFMEAILNPQQPNEALKKAFEKYKNS